MKREMNRTDGQVERLVRWEAGERPGPWEIVVYPTNRCNLRCKMCWQRLFERDRGGVHKHNEVPDARLLQLVDEAAELDVREWILCGGGDPLMRADLVMDMCERIVKRGMVGEVHCNGTLYDPEHLDHLIGIGWQRTGFSLDGPDASSNDALRTEGSFDRATANIRLLSEMKQRRGADEPCIGIHMTVANANCDKIDRMLQLTHDLGGRYFGVVMVRLYENLNEAFALDKAQYSRLHASLRRAIPLATKLGIETNLWTLLPPAETGSCRRGPIGDGRFSDAACFEPWVSMGILADGGRVAPCSAPLESGNDSIIDKSLAEAWQGPYLTDVRGRIRERVDLPPYCLHCPSFFRAQKEELRHGLSVQEHARWSTLDRREYVRLAARRFVHSVRRHGLRPTLRRAKEWVQVRLR